MIIPTLAKADKSTLYSRYDQFLLPGCKFTIESNGNLIQLCNGEKITPLVFNDQSSHSFFNSSTGPITGVRAISNGMLWVQNIKQNGGKYSLEVCESKSNIFGISETCQRVPIDNTSSVLSSNLHILVEKVRIDASYDGSMQDKNAGAVHKHGYFFNFFFNDCPYIGGKQKDAEGNDKCVNTGSADSMYNKDNNCYLNADFMSSVCPKATLCPCTTKEKQKCNYTFKPDSDNSLKDDNDAKSCYECHSPARIAYKKCLENANKQSGLKSFRDSGSSNVKSILASGYGPGQYLCAYAGDSLKLESLKDSGSISEKLSHSSDKDVIRAGCLKMQPTIGPRPFPRIAKADSKINLSVYPAAHLFLVYPFVEGFRDEDKNPGPCNKNTAELGESSRGTFFKPKIKVSLADTVKVITFTPAQNKSMASVYGGTIYKQNAIMHSDWNEYKPMHLSSSNLDENTCTFTVLKYKAFICTRIEYNPSDNDESYVAYHIPSLLGSDNAPDACDTYYNRGMLAEIGRTKRPPLKYSINIQKKTPQLPITITTDNHGTDKRYPVKVTLKPSFAYSDIKGYHDDLSDMEVDVSPSRFNVLTGKIESGHNCVMLFTHKVCIQEDDCAPLDYIDGRIRKKTDGELDKCNTTQCSIYKELFAQCEARTFCLSDSSTVEGCQQLSSRANLLKLEKDLKAYTAQDQWTPSVCLSSSAVPLLSDEDRRLYGDYGNKGMEHVIELVDVDNGTSGYAIRTFERSNFSIFGNILNVSTNYFIKKDIQHIIDQLKTSPFEYNRKVSEIYFGNSCDGECISKQIRVRRRTPKEMGGCLEFVSASNTKLTLQKNWKILGISDNMNANTQVQVVDFYIPLGCTFLDMAFQGPGGGGSSPAFSSFIGPKNYASGKGPGSTGGYGRLMFNALHSPYEEFLRIVRANSGNKISLSNAHGSKCTQSWADVNGFIVTNWDYHAIGILNSTEEIAYAYGGLSNVDAGDDCSINGHQTIIPGWAFHKKEYFVTNQKYMDSAGGKVSWMYPGNTTSNGEGAYVGSQYLTSDSGSHEWQKNNMFGHKRDFGYGGRSHTRCGTFFMFCITRYWTIGRGGPSGAYIEPSRVSKYTNYPEKLDSTSKGKLNAKCITMCPRMSIQTKIGTKDVICEYGGVMVSKLGKKFDSLGFDSQVPVGGYALPTHCVDKDGYIYMANSDMGIQKCPPHKVMYTGDNRYYGICADQNSYMSVFKALNYDDQNRENSSSRVLYTVGAGTYCRPQDQFCSATRYWDASKEKGIMLMPSLSDFSKYGRKCLPGGLWSIDTGYAANKPLKIFAKAAYKPIQPYKFPGNASKYPPKPNSTPSAHIQPFIPVQTPGIDASKQKPSTNFYNIVKNYKKDPKAFVDFISNPKNSKIFDSYNDDCPYIGGTKSSCPSTGTLKKGQSMITNCDMILIEGEKLLNCPSASRCKCNSSVCDSNYLPSKTAMANPSNQPPKYGQKFTSSEFTIGDPDSYNSSNVYANRPSGIPRKCFIKSGSGKYRYTLSVKRAWVKFNAGGNSWYIVSYSGSNYNPRTQRLSIKGARVHVRGTAYDFSNKVGADFSLGIEGDFLHIFPGSTMKLRLEIECQEHIYPGLDQACFQCHHKIRQAHKLCTEKVSKIQAILDKDSKIVKPDLSKIVPVLHDLPKGYARGVTVNEIINKGLDKTVSFMCPAINPEKFPYESQYSLNALWPQSDAGKIVQMIRCKEGYIPFIQAKLPDMNRKCSQFGIWKGLHIYGDKPCLYGCTKDVDLSNSIMWIPPVEYASAMSFPVCMDAKVLGYKNGSKQFIKVKTRFPAGVKPSQWIRHCNIPASKDPVKYADISPENPGNMLPHLSPRPPGAHCVPNTFVGVCMPKRRACYDAAGDGEWSIGHCIDSNNFYFVNGISVKPPAFLVSNGDLTNKTDTSVYVKADMIDMECSFDKHSASSNNKSEYTPFLKLDSILPIGIDFTCKTAKISTFLKSFYSDDNYGIAYENKFNNTKLNSFTDFSREATVALISKIKSDVAEHGEDCTVNSTHSLAEQIFRSMEAFGACSSACFNDKVNKFETYTCTDNIPIEQNTGDCMQVCSSDTKRIYYSFGTGITSKKPTNSAKYVDLANTSHCIGIGVPKALIAIRSNQPALKIKVGDFCNKVFFSSRGSAEDGALKVDQKDPIFNNQFDNTQLSCSRPKSCIAPSGSKIPHGSTELIGIADSSFFTDTQYRFSYSGSILPDNRTQRLKTNNVFLMKLGCVNGELFLLKMSNGFGMDIKYTISLNKLDKIEYARLTLMTNAKKLEDWISFNISKFVSRLDIDVTTPISYYLSLRRLDKKNINFDKGGILRDNRGHAKDMGDGLKGVPSQIQDYSTMNSTSDIESVFNNQIDLTRNITMESSDKLYIKLNDIGQNSQIYSFAIWSSKPISHRIDYSGYYWNIIEIPGSEPPVYIGIGRSDFTRTDYILDFDNNSLNAGSLLRSSWIIMCSKSKQDCVIKSRLTGMFVSKHDVANETVKMDTNDIAYAAKFTLSN